jgi:hypothetical protein
MPSHDRKVTILQLKFPFACSKTVLAHFGLLEHVSHSARYSLLASVSRATRPRSTELGVASGVSRTYPARIFASLISPPPPCSCCLIYVTAQSLWRPGFGGTSSTLNPTPVLLLTLDSSAPVMLEAASPTMLRQCQAYLPVGRNSTLDRRCE